MQATFGLHNQMQHVEQKTYLLIKAYAMHGQ